MGSYHVSYLMNVVIIYPTQDRLNGSQNYCEQGAQS